MKKKALTQNNTLLRNAEANAEGNFFKRVFFSPPQEEIQIIFFSTLRFFNYFFFQRIVRNRTDIASNVNRFVTSVCKFDTTHLRAERRATDNSGFKKLAVQWLNDPDSSRDCTSYQVLWWQTVFVSEIANFL